MAAASARPSSIALPKSSPRPSRRSRDDLRSRKHHAVVALAGDRPVGDLVAAQAARIAETLAARGHGDPGRGTTGDSPGGTVVEAPVKRVAADVGDERRSNSRVGGNSLGV